jgi:hypothetical protein
LKLLRLCQGHGSSITNRIPACHGGTPQLPPPPTYVVALNDAPPVAPPQILSGEATRPTGLVAHAAAAVCTHMISTHPQPQALQRQRLILDSIIRSSLCTLTAADTKHKSLLLLRRLCLIHALHATTVITSRLDRVFASCFKSWLVSYYSAIALVQECFSIVFSDEHGMDGWMDHL